MKAKIEINIDTDRKNNPLIIEGREEELLIGVSAIMTALIDYGIDSKLLMASVSIGIVLGENNLKGT